MNPEKQKLLIEYLISSPNVFTMTNNIIKHKYFDPEFRNTVVFIKEYYERYRALPDSTILLAETDINYKTHELTRDKTEYCIYEIESFCQNKGFEFAIYEAAEQLNKGDIGRAAKEIKEAELISVQRSIGVSVFDDADRILDNIEQAPAMSTGYTALDSALFGGMRRGELNILAGGSGAGKSVFLANFACNYSKAGYCVLYISLELSESMILSRLSSIITGVSNRDLIQRKDEVKVLLKQKSANMKPIHVVQLPNGSNVNDFKSLINELDAKHNFYPDVILVDYLDLVGTNAGLSSENINNKDKASSEELRNLAQEHETNTLIITVSQLNRQAVGQDSMDHSHIAGGISKIQTSDNVGAIISSDIMKQQNRVGLQLIKTRSSDGVGSYIELHWNTRNLRITNASPELTVQQRNPITNEEMKAAKNEQRSKLLERFKDL